MCIQQGYTVVEYECNWILMVLHTWYCSSYCKDQCFKLSKFRCLIFHLIKLCYLGRWCGKLASLDRLPGAKLSIPDEYYTMICIFLFTIAGVLMSHIVTEKRNSNHKGHLKLKFQAIYPKLPEIGFYLLSGQKYCKITFTDRTCRLLIGVRGRIWFRLIKYQSSSGGGVIVKNPSIYVNY